jgi:pyrroloquinoline quinone biosynthesis protein E
MPEPCRTCTQRTVDYGGCRYQAFHLTGVAAATDPVCRFSRDHGLIKEARIGAYTPHEQVLLRPRVLKGVP